MMALAYNEILVAITAVTAITLVGWLASLILPRRPAVRHSLLLYALLCALAAPSVVALFAVAGVSFWELPVLVSEKSGVIEGTAEGEPSADDAGVRPALVIAAAEPHDSPAVSGQPQLPGAGRSPVTDSAPDAQVESETAAGDSQQTASSRETVFNWLLCGWLAGVLLLSAGFGIGWSRVARLLARSSPCTTACVLRIAEDVRREFRLRSLPPIVVSEEVTTAMAAGLFRPRIVLPAAWCDIVEASTMQDILTHEIAHIVRRDHFVVLCQAAARIVFWPIITVHLLNRALMCAREEVCDNYVLAGRDAVAYSETLFLLAQLSPRVAARPATAGILHGRGRLETRIADLLDNRRNRMTRPRRFTRILLGFMLVSVCAALSGAQLVATPRDAVQKDSTQPKPAASDADAHALRELVAGLKATETAIRNLSVTTEYVKLQKFGLPVDKPVRMGVVTRAIIHRDGRAWNDSVGEQVNIEPDGKSVRLYNVHVRGAFDGKAARRLTGSGDGRFHSGSIGDVLTWHGVNPREFTTHYFRKPVSQILTNRKATIFKRAKRNKRAVVVVDTIPKGTKTRRKFRFWIDPERKTVVRRALMIQFKPQQKFQEYTRIESHDYRQIEPGIWLPGRVKYESVEVTADLTPETLSWSYTGTNRDWKVNQKLPDETFLLKFPDNIRVRDRRVKAPKKKRAAKPAPETETTGNADDGLSRFLARIEKANVSPLGKASRRVVRDANGRIVSLLLQSVKLKPVDYTFISRLPHLETLDLSNTGARDTDLAQIGKLKTLRSLNLWNSTITDAGVQQLQPLTRIEWLNLGSTRISNAGLKHLSAFRSLNHLTLTRNKRISDAGLVHIARLTSLTTLKLGETATSNKGLRLIKSLKTLRGLTLDQTKVTEEGIEELATDPRFRWMETPKKTAEELARRLEQGDFRGVTRMLSIGLSLPTRGEFTRSQITALPQTSRDRTTGRRRFRLEMHWVDARNDIADRFYAQFAVDRGAINVHSIGIMKR